VRRFLSLTALIILVNSLLWNALALAQERQSIGKVVALQGQGTVQRAGNSLPLQLQSPVYQDDVIRTAAASRVKLTLLDGTELSLGEEGSLTLSKFVYAPQQKSHNVLVRIATGAFRAVTGSVLPQATFEIQTATAVAAVRGTRWMGQVSAEATAIFVMHGQVVVRHAEPGIGGEVVVSAGMGTDVRGTQPPTAPGKWKEARIEALQKAVTLP
jgi:hypothetical protein